MELRDSKIRNPECPVCMSKRTFFLRCLKGQRTANYLRLYFCRNCHSLFNSSGYREDEKALIEDKEWHINHFDLVSKNTDILLNRLKEVYPKAKTFLDVGCGIGTAVLQAKSLGLDAIGVDPNPFAVEYGRERFSLDLRCNYFSPDLFQTKFDIITCTHVLEHLENPRKLLGEAIETLNAPGLLFVSVPFKKRLILNLIYILFPNFKGTPFCDNDVHITHFSHRSFRLWANEFGAQSYEYVKDGWQGYIFKFH